MDNTSTRRKPYTTVSGVGPEDAYRPFHGELIDVFVRGLHPANTSSL